MNYKEEIGVTDSYKEQYLKGIYNLIKKRDKEWEKRRNAYARDMITNPERYRMDLAKLLGWPLPERLEAQKSLRRENDMADSAVMEKLAEEDTYTIYRMQLPVLEDVVLTGLLFRYQGEEKRPFVIAQHGGLGTPELISGMYGKTYNYNNMLHRALKKKVHVFAPQLLIWSTEEYKPAFDRQVVDARLKSVGSSIAAVEIYALMRVMDYFELQSWVGKIGMAGLSYGGFYTLFTAALDTRIEAAVSSSFFCDISHYCLSDFTWWNMRECFGNAETACLVYPRKLFLGMGREDPLFDSSLSEKEYKRLCKFCEEAETEWVEFTIFPGKHEFYPTDESIEKLIACLQ